MSRKATLALWAIPSSAKWSLSKLGVDITIPEDAQPKSRDEAALQHAITVGAIAASSIVIGPLGLVLAGIVAIVKIKNLLTHTYGE